MHMISKKDWNSAKLDTLTTSRSPTTVITANGEVQTHEEATVYVKELDTFLTMNVLEDTPAVLSLGKLCDENGHSYEWINGQKPHLIKNGIRRQCNTENFVLSWFQACQPVRPPVLISQLQGHFQDRRGIVLHLLQARHGKTEAQKDHFVAHNARKRCIKKNYDGIHDRFQRDPENRHSQLKIGWTEEKCIEMDNLAQENHFYCPSS